MGDLVGCKTALGGGSGGGSIMICEHHAFRDTDKERHDLVLVLVAFRRRHGDPSLWIATAGSAPR